MYTPFGGEWRYIYIYIYICIYTQCLFFSKVDLKIANAMKQTILRPNYIYIYIYRINWLHCFMLSTLVIVALQNSRRVFWFSFGHWPSTPWFFSRSRTRWSFLSFLPKKLFSFFLWTVIRDILALVMDQGFFGFFLVPWILVDSRLVNI